MEKTKISISCFFPHMRCLRKLKKHLLDRSVSFYGARLIRVHVVSVVFRLLFSETSVWEKEHRLMQPRTQLGGLPAGSGVNE